MRVRAGACAALVLGPICVRESETVCVCVFARVCARACVTYRLGLGLDVVKGIKDQKCVLQRLIHHFPRSRTNKLPKRTTQ